MSPSKEQIYGFLNGTVTEDQLRSTLNGPQPAGSTNKNGAAIANNAIGQEVSMQTNHAAQDLATITVPQKEKDKVEDLPLTATATASIIDVHEVKGKLVTTSSNVAKVFGKQHRDVTRAVEDYVRGITVNTYKKLGLANFGNTPKTILDPVEPWSDQPAVLMPTPTAEQETAAAAMVERYFIEQDVVNLQNGQSYTEYLITRDGLTLLAMGFTGKKALGFKLAYIDRFNEMEAQLNARNTPTLQSLVQGVDWLPAVPDERADSENHVTYPQLTSQVSTALSTRLPQEFVERIIGYITYAANMAYKKGRAVATNEAQRALANTQQAMPVEFVDRGAYDELQAAYNELKGVYDGTNSALYSAQQQANDLANAKQLLEVQVQNYEAEKERLSIDKTLAEIDARNQRQTAEQVRHNAIEGFLQLQQCSTMPKVLNEQEAATLYQDVPLTDLVRNLLEEAGNALTDTATKLANKNAELRATKTQLKLARNELSTTQYELKQQKKVSAAALKQVDRLNANACANADSVQQLAVAACDAQDYVSELLAQLSHLQDSLEAQSDADKADKGNDSSAQ